MTDNRTRIWFALFVLAVFVVGLAGGVIIGRRLGPPPRDPMFAGRGQGGTRPPEGLIERLDRELQLTPDQRVKVAQILDDRRKRLEAVQGDVMERQRAEQQEFRAEIKKVLTADQQARFDRWLEAAPRGRRGRGPGGGFGDGMGPGGGFGPGGGLGPGRLPEPGRGPGGR